MVPKSLIVNKCNDSIFEIFPILIKIIRHFVRFKEAEIEHWSDINSTSLSSYHKTKEIHLVHLVEVWRNI